MKKSKQYYKSFNIDGFTWRGFWDKMHHFVKKECAGYAEIKCTEQDIEDGNIYDMVAFGVSR